MGFGEWLPQLGGLGLTGLGWLQQWGRAQEHKKWWENPPGSLEAGETLASPFLSRGDPGTQARLDTFAQETPGGAFSLGQEERTAAARAGQRERNVGIEAGITDRYEPLQEEARKRFETPAVSQSEVDMMVDQLRGNVNRSATANIDRTKESAYARGLAPDAIAAMEAQLSSDAGFQTHQGRLAAELQQEIANRTFEQQRFGDLMRITGAYDDSLVPQQNIGMQLMEDTGGMGRLGVQQVAAALAEQGMGDEDAAMIANMLTSMGTASIDYGETRRAENRMADAAGGGGFGINTPLGGFSTGADGGSANILGFGGSWGGGGGGGASYDPRAASQWYDRLFGPSGSSGLFGGARGLQQNPY